MFLKTMKYLRYTIVILVHLFYLPQQTHIQYVFYFVTFLYLSYNQTSLS
jgi:hypothetical protein